MIKKIANILDWPKPGLSPEIWNEDNILKPNVKKFILDFIHSFAQANNFKNTFVWLTQVKFVGSLTTNLWNSRSDVDIHCEVDLPKFVEIERPEMTEQEASDYLDGIRKQVDQVKAKVPETEHPLEIYFETEFTTRASQQFSGTYSVLENKWLSEPHIVGEDFDISTLHPDLLNLAKETAAELDEAFGELKQDVQDIKELAETISNWPAGQRELLEKKLQKRLDELEKEIKDLVIVREDVAEKRKHYNAISEQEVRFKYLQKYYYMHVLTDLKTLLTQSPELTTKDIPVVENIMQQASLSKKAYDYSSYWVDPNGEIYNANESHQEWLANNLELLYNDYGIRFSNAETPESMHNLDQQAIANYSEELVRDDTLLKEGWARVFVGDELAIQIKDLNNPSLSMEKPFIEFAADTKGAIIVSDLNHKTVSIGDELGFAKGIRKGLQEERMSQTSNLKLAYQEDLNRILVDMDDTICHETSDNECGEPMEGVKEALTKLKEMGYEIVIFSHRADDKHGEDEIKKYLEAHEIPYDSIFQGEKPLARFQIDDRAIHFDNWNSVLKQIEKSNKTASINLPVIDPATLNRKEPYALFIGTQRFPPDIAIDLFDVFGEHPMITESNRVPTVTLDTLVKENIPIIGKEPRAADKQPVQDLSGVIKTASLFKIGDIVKDLSSNKIGKIKGFIGNEAILEEITNG